MAECVAAIGCALPVIGYSSLILCENPSSRKVDVASMPFCQLFGGVAIVSHRGGRADDDDHGGDAGTPHRVIVPRGAEGEIWLCNPCLAAGYWRNEELTRETFSNSLPSYDPANTVHLSLVNDEETRGFTWLATGDLGFILDDHLFITGRCKDLIIVRGKNYYPQDIESILQQVDSEQGEDSVVRPGCVICFGYSPHQADPLGQADLPRHLADDTEGLVLVCEIRDVALQRLQKKTSLTFATGKQKQQKSLDEISLKLFHEVNKEVGSLLIQLVLIKERTIPKTTSGKLRRSHAKDLWLTGRLESVFTIPGALMSKPTSSIPPRSRSNLLSFGLFWSKPSQTVDGEVNEASVATRRDSMRWVDDYLDELKHMQPSEHIELSLREDIKAILEEYHVVEGDTSLVSLGLDSLRCFELFSVVSSKVKSPTLKVSLSSVQADVLFSFTGNDLVSLLCNIPPPCLTTAAAAPVSTPMAPIDVSFASDDLPDEAGDEEDAASDDGIASSPKRFVLMHQLSSHRSAMHKEINNNFEDSLNEFISLRIDGPLDFGAFHRAIERLRDRHESLRSYFLMFGGAISQLVESSCELVLEHIEGIPRGEYDEEYLRTLVLPFVETPFDLSFPPLWRCQLISLEEDCHVLTLVFHHSIIDGSSVLLLLKEFFLIYQHGDGEVFLSTLKDSFPLSRQQELERKYLSSQKKRIDLSYWEDKLTNYERLSFPSLSSSGEGDSCNEHIFFDIPADLTQLIKLYCQRLQVTPYVCYLAGFYCLLARYFSDREDFVVGTAFFNRFLSPETTEAIGCFVNTLPLRQTVRQSASFEDIVSEVRIGVERDLSHGQLPYERIVPEATRRKEFLDLFFVYQENILSSHHEIEGLTVRRFLKEHSNLRHQPYQLFFELREVDRVLEVLVSFNTSFLSKTMVERMFPHFLNILQQGIDSNSQKLPLCDFPLLANEELFQQVHVWNDPVVSVNVQDSEPATIHELFERQVERSPDRVAISFAGKSLTYLQLNERANRLAHILRDKWAVGSRPDMLVGIAVERSLEMSIGLLGILKVGGAYVPLDPSYPDERLSLLLEDAGLKVLLVHSSYQRERWQRIISQNDRIPSVSLVVLTENDELSSYSTVNPVRTSRPSDLCYVIYTSGSTGKPKGAMLEHAGVVNFLRSMNQTYGVTDSDVFLQKTAFTFDASVPELFCPLLVGARLVFAVPEGHRDAQYLVQVLREERVTILSLVPSMISAILDVLESRKEELEENPLVLRLVYGVGEILSRSLAGKMMRLLPEVALHNQYGPTEASIASSDFRCSSSSVTWTGPDREPIGKAFPNVSHYLLSESGRLLPAGMVGELFIGGIGLARGYLNRPELTAERFIEHSFPELGQTIRLYRTGDLARFLEDGSLDCLGRGDHQVKIRGFRVELGEIECNLLRHSQVKEAAVIVSDRLDEDNKQLIGFVVLRPLSGYEQNAATGMDELRAFLRVSLPDQMVPARLIVLEAMPLLSSGKLDRKALLSRATSVDFTPTEGNSSRAPSAGMEMTVAAMWSELLGVPLSSLRADDNFFDLGGNSLVVLRCLSLFQAKLQRSLTFIQFYRFPTLEAISRLLTRGEEPSDQQEEAASLVVRLSSTKVGLPKLFLVHPVLGLASFYQSLVPSLAEEFVVYGVNHPLLSNDQHAKSFSSLEELAAEYLRQVRLVCPEGPLCLGGWSLGGIIALEMARQLEQEGGGSSVSFLLLLDSHYAPHYDTLHPSELTMYAGSMLQYHQQDLAPAAGRSDELLQRIVQVSVHLQQLHLSYHPRQPLSRLVPRVCLVKCQGYSSRLWQQQDRQVFWNYTNLFNGLGWFFCPGQTILLEDLACGHDELFEPSYLSALNQSIRGLLSLAMRGKKEEEQEQEQEQHSDLLSSSCRVVSLSFSPYQRRIIRQEQQLDSYCLHHQLDMLDVAPPPPCADEEDPEGSHKAEVWPDPRDNFSWLCVFPCLQLATFSSSSSSAASVGWCELLRIVVHSCQSRLILYCLPLVKYLLVLRLLSTASLVLLGAFVLDDVIFQSIGAIAPSLALPFANYLALAKARNSPKETRNALLALLLCLFLVVGLPLFAYGGVVGPVSYLFRSSVQGADSVADQWTMLAHIHLIGVPALLGCQALESFHLALHQRWLVSTGTTIETVSLLLVLVLFNEFGRLTALELGVSLCISHWLRLLFYCSYQLPWRLPLGSMEDGLRSAWALARVYFRELRLHWLSPFFQLTTICLLTFLVGSSSSSSSRSSDTKIALRLAGYAVIHSCFRLVSLPGSLLATSSNDFLTRMTLVHVGQAPNLLRGRLLVLAMSGTLSSCLALVLWNLTGRELVLLFLSPELVPVAWRSSLYSAARSLGDYLIGLGLFTSQIAPVTAFLLQSLEQRSVARISLVLHFLLGNALVLGTFFGLDDHSSSFSSSDRLRIIVAELFGLGGLALLLFSLLWAHTTRRENLLLLREQNTRCSVHAV
jgi:amino acid adenylation domain-containing protein